MNKAAEIYSKLIKEDHNRLVLAVDFDKMQKNIDNLQQRIDKAIETLEKRIEENEEIDYVDMTGKSYINYQKEIIDILRGEDEETK